MSFEEMLLKRESCRDFHKKPVSRDDLVKIVEAGRLSPSGCNSQPWKFIVADEPEALEGVCDALVVSGGRTACAWRADVPAFIVIVEQPAVLMPFALKYYKDSQRFAQGDIGAAVLNMCYQAE
ncbi:MAG: nitroreductase family protein, partial [Parasporobacterium sp.]|nr:nitroreductase family protein [Parasporobacterium sp.]